jgi:2-polyprenyl-3-methyl-5-hydroxy-6-metoxy-1,4-benzoquinol methylase
MSAINSNETAIQMNQELRMAHTVSPEECDHLKQKFADNHAAGAPQDGSGGDAMRTGGGGKGNAVIAYNQIQIPEEEGSMCTLKGQRDPELRYGLLNGVDFAGKTFLDLGCNSGGMVLAKATQVKQAVGVDFDPSMVELANYVANSVLGWPENDVGFHQFDLDKKINELDTLLSYEASGRKKFDIISMFAITAWVEHAVNSNHPPEEVKRFQNTLALLHSQCAHVEDRSDRAKCHDCGDRMMIICTTGN